MKLHKPFCGVIIVACVLHVIFAIPVFRTRNIFIYATGAAAVLFLVSIIISCHVTRKDTKKKWLKWHRILTGLSFVCIAWHMVVYCMDFREYQERISSIGLQGVETGNLADGKYIGEYDAGYIYAKVQVIISNGTIQNIFLLEHDNERGRSAEEILSDIVGTQSFPVDTVTGATNSSKVIQKAIQNALEGAVT